MKIIVQAGDDVLKRFGNQLGAVGSIQGRKALVRAVNRTTSTVHGRVIRAVAKQSSIPAGIVQRHVKKRLASHKGGALQGVVWATGKPLSLKFFKAKQYSWGVRTKELGEWKRYPSAFMGPKPGVISKKLGGHVYERKTEERFPIKMLFGPSIPEELVRDESARVFKETVEEMLPRRIAHELGRLLGR